MIRFIPVGGAQRIRDASTSGSGRSDSICHISSPPDSGINWPTDPGLGAQGAS